MRTRRHLSLRSLVLLAFLSVAGSGLVGACSDQGEGEPCSPLSTDDCQSNLTCTPVPNNGYRCCPTSGQPSANNICSPNNPGVNGSNPPPSDAGSSPGEDAEAGAAAVEAGPDSAAAEASIDAPADAADASTGGGDGPAAAEAGPSDAGDAASE